MEMSEVKNHTLGKFNAFTGQVIDLREPTVSMIHPEDIIQGLSKVCRFGGQLTNFYSVAQHSVLVAYLAPKELKRAALIHDATEAYLGDVIKPLKHMLGNVYADIEEAFANVIYARFNEPVENLFYVKQFDLQAYEMEKAAFKHGDKSEWVKFWRTNIGYENTVWSPNYAEDRFRRVMQTVLGKEFFI